MKPLCFALLVSLCAGGPAFADGPPPADGFHLLADEGAGPAVVDAEGRRWFWAGELDLPIQAAEIAAQDNANEEFRLTLEVPYDAEIHSRNYGLWLDGELLRHAGTGSDANAGASIHFRFRGGDRARRIADFLKIPVRRRERPDGVLAVAFAPAKAEFELGEIVMATMRVVNAGPAALVFRQGGMNRGSRDNQYAFTASRAGEPVPDVGSEFHRGGLSIQRELKPGEAFEARVSLNDWFTFDRPGRYEIRGTYRMEIWPAAGAETALPWDETLGAGFAVDIVAAAETAAPATAEEMRGFLERMGEQLDCYFSVEDIGRPGRSSNPMLSARVAPPPSAAIQTVDDLLGFLTNQVALVWEGRKIPLEAAVRAQDGRMVVALADAGLRHYPWYMHDRPLDFDYEGTLNGLVEALAETYPRLRRCTAAGMEGGIILAEGRTPAKVHVADTLIRDILSQAVPLEGTRRILWQSRALGAGSDLVVEMEYNGRKADAWRPR